MNKKTICFIDSLNSGGAQKQMSFIANGLAQDFDVKILIYHELLHFRKNLNEKVSLSIVSHKFYPLRVIKILFFLFNENPRNIIAFLTGPWNISALYKIIFFWRKVNLIVGERNLNVKKLTMYDLLVRVGHLVSNYVVCNSDAQKKMLSSYFRKNLVFIPNGNDFKGTQKFQYGVSDELRLIVPARFIDQKDPLTLLRALKRVSNVSVYWYGETFKKYPIYEKCIRYILANRLEKRFIIKKPTIEIYKVMLEFDALILPSIYEGCPNAVIDGMFCGLPILATDVSDNRIYLGHQEKWLFRPGNVDELVTKLNEFKKTSEKYRSRLGHANFCKAEKFFNIDKMVLSYQKLLK